MYKFVAVQFLDEGGGFNTVSERWITDVNGVNFTSRFPKMEDFPKKVTLKSLVTSHANCDSWKEYPCKIYEKFDTYKDSENEVVRLINEALSTCDESETPRASATGMKLRTQKKSWDPFCSESDTDEGPNIVKTKNTNKTLAPGKSALPPVPAPPTLKNAGASGDKQNSRDRRSASSQSRRDARDRRSTSMRSRKDSTDRRSTSFMQSGRDSRDRRSTSVRSRRDSRDRHSASRRLRRDSRDRHSASRRSRRDSRDQHSVSRRSRRDSRGRRSTPVRSRRDSRDRRSGSRRSRRDSSRDRRSTSTRSRSNFKDMRSSSPPMSRVGYGAIPRPTAPKSQSPRKMGDIQSSAVVLLPEPSDHYLHNDGVFRKAVIQGLASCKTLLVKLGNKFLTGTIPPDHNLEEIRKIVPVTSADALTTLNEELHTNVDMYKQLVTHLSLGGGDDVGNATRTAFRKILTDEVQQLYNWEGHKGKKKFHVFSEIKRALFESVRAHFPNASDVEIKSYITCDLRNAKQRCEAKKKKEAGRNEQGDPNETSDAETIRDIEEVP